MPRLLQFTDLHLRDNPDHEVRGVNTQRGFENALYHAQRHHWPADVILLTGDLANDEFEASYRRLASMSTAWDTPVMPLPGNHDDGDALRKAFGELPQAVDGRIDFDHWRIVGLDSQLPGKVHGKLDALQWQRLEDALLSLDGRHLLVALHHPPLEVGSRWIDRLALEGAAEFRQWLANFNVRVCLFGHAHQPWESEIQGVRYLGTPSTGRQFLRGSDTFAESDEPPGYRWLDLHDDGRVETGVEWIEAIS